MITLVPKQKIVSEVISSVKSARKEILATMLLSEELENPLPQAYHKLLLHKTEHGIKLERLGFGTKEEYNQINSLYKYSKNYDIALNNNVKLYQRMIIIDEKILFFGVEGIFFRSEHESLTKVFANYFKSL